MKTKQILIYFLFALVTGIAGKNALAGYVKFDSTPVMSSGQQAHDYLGGTPDMKAKAIGYGNAFNSNDMYNYFTNPKTFVKGNPYSYDYFLKHTANSKRAGLGHCKPAVFDRYNSKTYQKCDIRFTQKAALKQFCQMMGAEPVWDIDKFVYDLFLKPMAQTSDQNGATLLGLYTNNQNYTRIGQVYGQFNYVAILADVFLDGSLKQPIWNHDTKSAWQIENSNFVPFIESNVYEQNDVYWFLGGLKQSSEYSGVWWQGICEWKQYAWKFGKLN